MRVSVDADLCQGHAMCELEAPEVFSVPKAGPVAVVGDITDLESVRAAVEAAVRHCPTGALTLEED